MNVYNNSIQPSIAIIGCLHGDEVFGIDVIEYFKTHQKKYPMLKLVLAHTRAIKEHKRYIDEDLNRCFGYDHIDSYEKKLAQEIYKEIKDMDYIIDIHTTSSDLRMTPIVTKRNQKTTELISHTRSREVMSVMKPMGIHALIAQVDGGISLEFNEAYGKTAEALQDVIDMVDALLAKKVEKKMLRNIFHMDTVLSADMAIPDNAKNFVYSASLQCYPFLLHERSYTTYKGFGASGFEKEFI